MKQRKRLLAGILVFSLLFSLIPQNVFATEGKNEEVVTTEFIQKTEEMEVTTVEEQPVTEQQNMEEVTELVTEQTATDGATTEMAISTTEAVTTQEKTEVFGAFSINAMEENVIERLGDSSKKQIYGESTWGSGHCVWYTKDDNGNKHYLFCLNKGSTMRNGVSASINNSTGLFNAKDAFRITVALNYFKAQNSGGFSSSNGYITTQYVIWNESGNDEAGKLLKYINYLWNITTLNESKTSGSNTYDGKLMPISDATLTKAEIFSLFEKKKRQNIGTVTNAGEKLTKIFTLGGSAWKYFAASSGLGKSTVSVAKIYDKDGKAVSDASAEITEKGNIKVTVPIKKGYGDEKANAYTVSIKVTPEVNGATSFEYLNAGEGYQKLSYNCSGASPAYFAFQVYGSIEDERPDFEDAQVHIHKVDEYGNFVPGCTFELTCTSGEDAGKAFDPLPVNDEDQDYFKIEKAGTYQIVETAVPNDEFKVSSHVVNFTAVEKTENNITKILIQATHGEGVNTANWTYTHENAFNPGNIEFYKTGNVLVGRENGEFVYKQVPLEGVVFDLYAAEDIYANETLIFSENQQIKDGDTWGRPSESGNRIAVDVMDATNASGKMSYWSLPAGNYYVIEKSMVAGFTPNTKRYEVTVEAGKTVRVNGTEGVINEQQPAVCYVEKTDFDTNEALAGATFTLYASVNNTNYYGEALYSASEAVNAVVSRNLVTNEEVTEPGWVPIATATSDADGKLEFGDIPAGDYLVSETNAPAGYYLAETSYKFTHSYEENYTSSGYIFTCSASDVRKREFQINKLSQKAVTISPVVSNNSPYRFENEAIAGVEFGVYAAANIANTVGEVVLKQDDLVEVVKTNNQGVATVSNIVFAGKYYLKELKTAKDSIYELDTNKYSFTITAEQDSGSLIDKTLINKLLKGSIQIIKTDGTNTYYLSDVEFELMDSEKNVIGTYTTDANGEIKINNLPVGTYYIKETKAKDGYKLNDEVVEVEISKESLDQIVTMKNDKYFGSIKVIKTDGDTKVALEGVQFNLMDSDKKVIGTYTTDQNGEILVTNLELGTYYLRETETLEDYILSEKVEEIVISVESLNQIVKFKNYKEEVKGSIKVIKTDGETTKALEGVQFELLDSEKSVINTYTTDANGEIKINNLSVGTYYIKETKALTGYKLDETAKKVIIKKSSLDQVVEFENYREETRITVKTNSTVSGQGSVKTGDDMPVMLYIVLLGLSILGIVYCRYQYRNKKEMK